MVIWVLSFTYTKPCQIQRAFCVFTTEKRLLWSFEKNCSCHQSFHQKRFSTKKTILWKNLKQIVIALLKRTNIKTNKILMTIIKKKSERAVGYNASYFFTKKVVQKIRIEGSRCRSDLSDPCSHSSLFLFALGLKDGNRRILDCFPPYCNKPHFFPQSFSFFLSFAIVSSNL